MGGPAPATDAAARGKARTRSRTAITLGWCELVDLPDLGLDRVRAKMDSGAATSAIHATRIRTFERDGTAMVEFWFRRRAGQPARRHEAVLHGKRPVRSSNGILQLRHVIETKMKLGSLEWRGQVTLANRRSMNFPLLLGRRALRRGFLIDSARMWTLGRPVESEGQ